MSYRVGLGHLFKAGGAYVDNCPYRQTSLPVRNNQQEEHSKYRTVSSEEYITLADHLPYLSTLSYRKEEVWHETLTFPTHARKKLGLS